MYSTPSMSNRTTVEQLARRLGTPIRDVSKAAQQVVGLPAGNARDPQYKLNVRQCKEIERALLVNRPKAPDEAGTDRAAALTEDASADAEPLLTQADPKSQAGQLSFNELNLWIHEDILEGLERWSHLRKSSGAVLQRLAAHGRTSVVKGCKGAGNRGWRRSPLGGNGGMQYYLWWTVHGNEQADRIEGLRPGDIVVRAIRHHDDHHPLVAGATDDYLHGQSPVAVEDEIGNPWTSQQLDFVNDPHPVRLLLGQPGAGKTTALWKAIEARGGQRVLYLTWSRELTEHAREHLTTFAPRDVRLQAQDFTTFLAELCAEDIHRLSSHNSRSQFRTAVFETKLGPADLGVWREREDALFAEVRAVLLGASVPGDSESTAVGSHTRLGDRAYRRLRAKALGTNAADSALKIVDALQPGTLDRIFPELAAASSAVARLHRGDIPEGYDDFDRVVVDEAQDLTLLEMSVVVELCRGIARARGRTPWLLLAGDEGQTVRPSGFSWGVVNDLLARKISPTKKFPLEGNLRCPARIADIIDRASERYGDLAKARRPSKQQGQTGGHDLDAQVLHVVVASRRQAQRLLVQLTELESVTVVTPEPDPPAWLPQTLRDAVLTPAEAKGLEYQAVCVLDPGAFLAGLDHRNDGTQSALLEEHVRRTAIDRLRVALSRSTETLVFVDVSGDDVALNLSRQLLDGPVPFEPADLVQHLADTETTAEERVDWRIQEARVLVDERPGQAWLRADQAVKLLGDPELPNGVADKDLRKRARVTLLATAARLLIDGMPDSVARQDVGDAARKAIADLEATAGDPKRTDALATESIAEQLTPPDQAERSTNLVAFNELEAWAWPDRATCPPFGLLNATLALGNQGEWLRAAIPPVQQTLRSAIERHAATTSVADALDGDVEGWLELTSYAGVPADEARRLRIIAAEVLIDHDTEAAGRVLAKVIPEETRLVARLLEAQSRFEEAAETFERAEMPRDALRAWRMAGRWEKAVRFADGTARGDLEWLLELEHAVVHRPERVAQRMTNAERERLDVLANALGNDELSVELRKEQHAGIAAATHPPTEVDPVVTPGGKYQRLHEHLKSTTSDHWQFTFREIESIIGASLPASAYRHAAWWSNTGSHSQANAWLAAGFRSTNVDLHAEQVIFARQPNT